MKKKIAKIKSENGWPAMEICVDPNHCTPSHLLKKPGKHVHICPTCGYTDTFTIPRPTL